MLKFWVTSCLFLKVLFICVYKYACINDFRERNTTVFRDEVEGVVLFFREVKFKKHYFPRTLSPLEGSRSWLSCCWVFACTYIFSCELLRFSLERNKLYTSLFYYFIKYFLLVPRLHKKTRQDPFSLFPSFEKKMIFFLPFSIFSDSTISFLVCILCRVQVTQCTVVMRWWEEKIQVPPRKKYIFSSSSSFPSFLFAKSNFFLGKSSPPISQVGSFARAEKDEQWLLCWEVSFYEWTFLFRQ